MTDAFTIYVAGDIFDHKQLIGNALLASFIDRLSEGRYQCVLPQDFEQGFNRRVSIRNQDLRMVIESDVGLFNFDGSDLDSGTVVEFMVAKQLDIPAVLFRSDIRFAGDQDADGDNWNLMCSNYPRTETVRINGMELYRNALGSDLMDRINTIYTTLATELIEALDSVRQLPPIANTDDLMTSLYQWTTQYCGSGMETLLEDPTWLKRILKRKQERGLIN